MPILIGIVALVLIGLLFGFHIQVSTSVVNFISSIGTLVGGFGTAYVAYLAHTSLGEWRKEFHYKNVYSQLSDFEAILRDMLDDFNEDILSHTNLGDIKNTEVPPLLAKTLNPYEKKYLRLHNSILNGLPEKEARNFERLNYILVCREIKMCFFTGLSNYQRLMNLAKDIAESEHNVEEKGQQLTSDMAEFLRMYEDYRQHVQRYLKIVKDIRTSL
ncbi:hypothetical protein [Vibrio alginolyticus]|uniref:hypothetical protein n=2 Tax=Vibrio alginolyticus TaxID=663 RepID=UPI0022AAF91F|nr:hypothetical protein [Vibrio alginolyticus]MCZ2803119.1 hypothetical protein [Vibrio alginolyticus]